MQQLSKRFLAILTPRKLPPDIIPAGETPAEAERRLDQAEAAHDQMFRGQLAVLPTVITFGAEALKSAALINGGAAAALLAYIGAGRQEVTATLIEAMRWFGTGLLIAAFAHPTAYLTQFLYQFGSAKQTTHLVRPYVRPSRVGVVAEILGGLLHLATIALVLYAFWCAYQGFDHATSAMHPMGAVPRTR